MTLVVLAGRVATAWGPDTLEVEPGSARHRIFEAHSLMAHDVIVDDRNEQHDGMKKAL
ncbi:hypothetical protein [Brevibacterium album]|uniref:hypothetical protein n=1 Tax=Brevibacterium album TaxID=417948 RepID=UPI001FE23BC7|nr:hypothetical protein [Brevibacterium album]